jgi:hypothetical protein
MHLCRLMAFLTVWGCNAVHAQALWSADTAFTTSLHGRLENTGDGAARFASPNGSVVVTEEGVFTEIVANPEIASRGRWLFMKGNSPFPAEYVRTMESDWRFINRCTELLAGSLPIYDDLHCDGPDLALMDETKVRRWLRVPEGFVVKHLISARAVLLQNSATQFYVATVGDTGFGQPQIVPGMLGQPDNLTAVERNGSFILSYSLANDSEQHVWTWRGGSGSETTSFTPSSFLRGNQQCISIDILSPSVRIARLETDGSVFFARRYSRTGVLINQLPSSESDEIVCTRSSALFESGSAQILRRQPSGDSLLAFDGQVTFDGGTNRLINLKQSVLVQNAAGSVFRSNGTSAVTHKTLISPSVVASAPFAPVILTEVIQQADGSRQLNITTRSATSGAVESSASVPLPIEVTSDMISFQEPILISSNKLLLSAASAQRSWLMVVNTANLSVVELTTGSTLGQPLVVKAGPSSIAALQRAPLSGGEAILHRWTLNGVFQRSETIDDAQDVQPLTDGKFLLLRWSDSAARSASLFDESGVVWTRENLSGCTIQTTQSDIYAACTVITDGIRYTSVRKLSNSDGSDIYETTIVPAAINRPFQAQTLWRRLNQLYVVDYPTKFVPSPKLQVAVLDASSGKLLSVSPYVELWPNVQEARVDFSSNNEVAFASNWLVLGLANRTAASTDLSIRNWVAIQPFADGRVETKSIGNRWFVDQELFYSGRFVSSLMSNDGPRFYLRTRSLSKESVEAFEYPVGSASSPVSVSAAIGTSAGLPSNRVSVLVTVQNSNPVALNGLNLETNLSCVGVPSNVTQHRFSMNASSIASFNCTATIGERIGEHTLFACVTKSFNSSPSIPQHSCWNGVYRERFASGFEDAP